VQEQTPFRRMVARPDKWLPKQNPAYYLPLKRKDHPKGGFSVCNKFKDLLK